MIFNIQNILKTLYWQDNSKNSQRKLLFKRICSTDWLNCNSNQSVDCVHVKISQTGNRCPSPTPRVLVTTTRVQNTTRSEISGRRLLEVSARVERVSLWSQHTWKQQSKSRESQLALGEKGGGGLVIREVLYDFYVFNGGTSFLVDEWVSSVQPSKVS